VAALVEQALSAPTLPLVRQRKGKEVADDLRPHVWALRVVGDHLLGTELEAELGTQPRALRPSELVAVLGPSLTERRVIRMHQWMSLDRARIEPLPFGTQPAPTPDSLLRLLGEERESLDPVTARAPHAEVRAS
jgi:hypothetical protein